MRLQSITDKSKWTELTLGDRIINCISIDSKTGIAVVTDGERSFKIKTPAINTFLDGKESPASEDDNLFGLENLAGQITSKLARLNISAMFNNVFQKSEMAA